MILKMVFGNSIRYLYYLKKEILEEGKPMNFYSKYLKNGKKVNSGNLTDGNGEVFDYDDLGKIIRVDKYKNGKPIKSS